MPQMRWRAVRKNASKFGSSRSGRHASAAARQRLLSASKKAASSKRRTIVSTHGPTSSAGRSASSAYAARAAQDVDRTTVPAFSGRPQYLAVDQARPLPELL